MLSRTGKWLPADHRIHKKWLSDTVAHMERNPTPLHPIIEDFKDLIEKDTRLFLLINSMFHQIPHKKPYFNNPAGNRQVRNHIHMLRLMNHLMATAPAYSEKEHRVGLVGLPFWALFDWPMGTPSGFAVFQDPHVNSIMKKILNEWGRFLQSEKSASVSNTQPHGWFGPTGKRDLEMTANEAAGTSLKFEEIFECDPKAKYRGFKSWNNSFTRKFREGSRPVAAPNRDDVIINACEATPYKVGYASKLARSSG